MPRSYLFGMKHIVVGISTFSRMSSSHQTDSASTEIGSALEDPFPVSSPHPNNLDDTHMGYGLKQYEDYSAFTIE